MYTNITSKSQTMGKNVKIKRDFFFFKKLIGSNCRGEVRSLACQAPCRQG